MGQQGPDGPIQEAERVSGVDWLFRNRRFQHDIPGHPGQLDVLGDAGASGHEPMSAHSMIKQSICQNLPGLKIRLPAGWTVIVLINNTAFHPAVWHMP